MMDYVPDGYLSLDKGLAVFYLGMLSEWSKRIKKYSPDNDDILCSKTLEGKALTFYEPNSTRFEESGQPLYIQVYHPTIRRHPEFGHDYSDIVGINLKPSMTDIMLHMELPGGLKPLASPETGLLWIRNRLSRGSILSHIVKKTGSIDIVPNSYWNSHAAQEVLRYDVTAHIPYESSFEQGKIVFSIKSFENYFGINRDKLDNIIEEQRGYIPPFVEFMLIATSQLGLNPNARTDKETITNWLEKNWPPYLGKPTERKISTMATFLRLPEDQDGGFFRRERGSSRNMDRAKGGTPQVVDKIDLIHTYRRVTPKH